MHILSELASLYCIHNDYAYLTNVYIIYIHYFRYGNGIEKRNLTRLGGGVQTAFFSILQLHYCQNIVVNLNCETNDLIIGNSVNINI